MTDFCKAAVGIANVIATQRKWCFAIMLFVGQDHWTNPFLLIDGLHSELRGKNNKRAVRPARDMRNAKQLHEF